MSYKAMKIDLTEKQAMQALRGKAIRIFAGQIGKGSTFVSLHPENVKKVEKAFIAKKNIMLHLSQGELADTAHRMAGSGFWGNLWNGLKKTWGFLKDSGIATAGLDAAASALAKAAPEYAAPVMVGRQLIKKATGAGVDVQQVEPVRQRMSKNDRFAQLKGAGIYLS